MRYNNQYEAKNTFYLLAEINLSVDIFLHLCDNFELLYHVIWRLLCHRAAGDGWQRKNNHAFWYCCTIWGVRPVALLLTSLGYVWSDIPSNTNHDLSTGHTFECDMIRMRVRSLCDSTRTCVTHRYVQMDGGGSKPIKVTTRRLWTDIGYITGNISL